MAVGADVLGFEDVALEPGTEYAVGLDGVSFVLRAGELLLVEVERHRRDAALADLATGIAAPDRGSVRFRGRKWPALDPGEAARERARIGRVFQGHAWISNLDVDENVTLKLRHHTDRAPADILREANALASRFGLDALPSARPAWLGSYDLMRMQWVRALLGAPELLVLEHPAESVPEQALPEWRSAVTEALARGAAAVWISADERVLQDRELPVTLRYKVKGGPWQQEGGGRRERPDGGKC